ncbi:MAG: ABC transporter permease [Rhodospirillaceae bacterium]|nr:ABC transporter permease [Rhodospirillaceae bacterium]
MANPFFLTCLVKGFASYGQTVLMQKTGLRVDVALQNEMFDRIVSADLAYIHGGATGKLMSRFTIDLLFLRDAVTKSFTGIGRDLLKVIVLIGVMFHTHWQLALMVLFVFPASVYPIVYIGKRMRRISDHTQQRIGSITSFLDEVFKGMRQVKADGMEEFERGRASNAFEELFSLHYKAGRTRSRTYPIMELMIGIAGAGILGFAGYHVITQGTNNSLAIDAGQFVTFFLAMIVAYQPVRALANLNASLQQGMAAAERVFSIVDYKPSIVSKADAKTLQVTEGEVEFDSVEFVYGDEKAALKNIDIRIPAGKTVALVGPSGAGKSTMLNMIPRFYDVAMGSVKIDGVDVRDVTLDSLRAQIAFVSQDAILFNDTIRANIAYGCPDLVDEDIIAAAKGAAAHEFIIQLSEGYDTHVGERGVKLSGGERQRISIARAMLRNAPILLLDEATSALDATSERKVQAALGRLMEGRTTLVIAHRLSTVTKADLIVVLNEGTVLEQGTHTSLLADDGLYAQLCRIQFEDNAALGKSNETVVDAVEP